jgi:hypothetical protein
MRLPVLLDESQISPFHYYWGNAIRLGMIFRGQLYGWVKQFPATQRPQAYEQGIELSRHAEVVLSLSSAEHQYSLWIQLSAVSAPDILNQSAPSPSQVSARHNSNVDGSHALHTADAAGVVDGWPTAQAA